jgi:hypothetical protein
MQMSVTQYQDQSEFGPDATSREEALDVMFSTALAKRILEALEDQQVNLKESAVSAVFQVAEQFYASEIARKIAKHRRAAA